MDILVNISNQRLKIATNLKTIVAGTQNFVRFVFNLTSDWDDLLTFAQFRQGKEAYNVFLDEENCAYLPPEIGVGTCTLMLYGSSDKTIGTTNYLTLTIDENILVTDANSTEITESLYNQLVDKVNSLDIEDAVAAELAEYLQSGKLTAMTIEDGSISRAKLDSDVNESLNRADGAVIYNTGQGLNAYSKTTARSNIGIYTSAEEPANAVDGDIWFDPDDTDYAGGGTSTGTVQVDTTLSVSGMAADAKVVGDKLGVLSSLTTTDQSSLVAAINEVNALIGDIGAILDEINGEVV